MEPLLVRGFNINFCLEKNFPTKKKNNLLNISFINIPLHPETPDKPLTDYLSKYANIVGEPLYIQKDYQGIPYFNSTQVYQVKTLHQHIPRFIHKMFGRTVMCIYDNQPTNQATKKNTHNTNNNIHYNNKPAEMNQNQTQQDNSTITTDIDQQQINNKNQDDQNEETSTTIMERNHQQTKKTNRDKTRKQ